MSACSIASSLFPVLCCDKKDCLDVRCRCIPDLIVETHSWRNAALVLFRSGSCRSPCSFRFFSDNIQRWQPFLRLCHWVFWLSVQLIKNIGFTSIHIYSSLLLERDKKWSEFTEDPMVTTKTGKERQSLITLHKYLLIRKDIQTCILRIWCLDRRS